MSLPDELRQHARSEAYDISQGLYEDLFQAAERIEYLEAVLDRIARDDYRGPRPWASTFAEEALHRG